MEFEWNEDKEQKNIEKHGIDFDEAKSIWDGPILEVPSNRHGEARFTTIGKYGEHYFTVVWTRRGERIRIISARRARRRERADYQSQVG